MRTKPPQKISRSGADMLTQNTAAISALICQHKSQQQSRFRYVSIYHSSNLSFDMLSQKGQPMNDINSEIRQRLFDLQDIDYKAFHSKLMPTIAPELIIGVRTPDLRKLAKEFAKNEKTREFLNTLPHHYYEENNLHGFILEQIKDFESCVKEVDRFLPYVDNWATCDMLRPKIFKKHLTELSGFINKWLASDKTYTVRFGIGMLLSFYLDDTFEIGQAETVAGIRSEEYYINMMIAWYFATALSKQYETVLPFLTEKRLDTWTHNKTIQKAIESNRITKERKDYLRTLKRKEA